MTIVADSGATKVDWMIISIDGTAKPVRTPGISPVYCQREEIIRILSENVAVDGGSDADKVFFYGAGVVGEAYNTLMECLKEVFPKAECHAESDIVGAARALWGHQAGIAAILGTGSNSCFYDGESVLNSVHAGGFIIGDEGSGADMGKRLVSDYIKGLMPKAVEDQFKKRFKLDYAGIVQKVYREPMPSRFLASFAPFIEEFQHHPYMTGLIESSFTDFLMRNITAYDYRRYPVSFVGSIAEVFKPYLLKCVKDCGMRMGTVFGAPIGGLVKYHTEN
jgi:Predicted N-acetylglucosamine kinase